MKKLIAAMLIMGMGIAGVQAEAQVAPTLTVVSETQTRVRLRLTAGSEMIDGFSLYYEVPGYFYSLTQFYGTAVAENCEIYQLNPGESVEVNIGKIQRHDTNCRADFWPHRLRCNTTYLFQAVPHNAGGADQWSAQIAGTTAPCL
jgi:hypothetical protein